MKWVEFKKIATHWPEGMENFDSEPCEISADNIWLFYDWYGWYDKKARKVNVTKMYLSENYDIDCIGTADELSKQVDGFIKVRMTEMSGAMCYINKKKILYIGMKNWLTTLYVGRMQIQCLESVEDVKRMIEEV